MNLIERLAVVGSGASSIYLLKHLLDHASSLKGHLQEISIFERQDITGMGMPYNPKTTDHYNMSNISSEELPELPVTFGDWLRSQDSAVLEELRIEREAISDSEVYNRLALGQYLQAQYKRLIAELAAAGVRIHEQPDCEVVDLEEHPEGGIITLVTQKGDRLAFERVVIATGHSWGGEDRPSEGYYASPWPIYKLLPDTEQLHNFAIGTLGASLSAFDVISSLAHRHGEFVETADGMTFHPHSGTEQFKIVMHAANGLLPHLQFDQEEPLREIYRHVDRVHLLALVDAQGFLRFETYFDKVCRPALSQAFAKDGMTEMVARLAEPTFGISAFVEKMT
ncbi:MAG: FAD/NAD(P)-binding protein, partial [Verrucomicrobium sp.]